ncbi:hypothetical protein [Candidatus Lokiarchaeum ossiferum]|uniref:hypothetical protein n=1 Tax=Candidatus Lokiarchaeum ossiferum TaxID=2951803 RepID=UPI00352FB7B8
MGRRKSQSKERWDVARILALIGALLALAGFAIGIYTSASNQAWLDVLYQLIGIVISILVLIQVEIVKTKFDVPFKWWMLLIFVCVQAAMAGITVYMNLAGLGVLLEVVAVILLLINAL